MYASLPQAKTSATTGTAEARDEGPVLAPATPSLPRRRAALGG
jgi:hypothetical protein